jgi:hypothetical protein
MKYNIIAIVNCIHFTSTILAILETAASVNEANLFRDTYVLWQGSNPYQSWPNVHLAGMNMMKNFVVNADWYASAWLSLSPFNDNCLLALTLQHNDCVRARIGQNARV